ncbi:MAG: hypothetical protein U9O82_05890 [Thermodesulfobacteriota bacterium]|nr:hypothetical protein [Thermodesulfobacteriota bacterium]
MTRTSRVILLAVAFFSMFGTATLSKAHRDALAIFNFRPTNMEAMGYNSEILFALLSALEQKKTIEVMPRREMEEILFQEGLIQGDNPEIVLNAGKFLGIRFILFGNVSKQGSAIHSRLSLMDIQKKRVVKEWSYSFSGRDNILAKAPQIADELAAAVTVGGGNSAAAAVSESRQERPRVDIETLRARSNGKQVVLTWKFDPAQPITGFQVYRSDRCRGPYQFVGRTNKNEYLDSKVTTGRAYHYQVGILTVTGQEVKNGETASVEHTGEKMPHPPLAMEGKGFVRRTAIKFIPSLLNQQEKITIKQYKIYRRKSADEKWEYIASVGPEQKSSYDLFFKVEDIKGLEDGQTYMYALSSLDKKKNKSELSDTISVTTLPCPVLTLEKDNMLRKINLSWQPLKGVDGYRLYRKTKGSDWEKVAKISSYQKPGHKDKKGLSDGLDYLYHLTAYDSKSETGPSNEISAGTKDLHAFPEGLEAQGGLVKSVRISWTPLNDPDVGGYRIYRGTDIGRLKRIAEVRGYKSGAYMDKGTGFTRLEDGQTCFYAVESYNLHDAEGPLSPAVKAKTKPRPVNIKGFAVSAGSDHILIKWDKNPEPDIKVNLLYRSRNQKNWSKIKTLTTNEIRFADNDLRPEETYRYRIIAEDVDGLKSDPVESNPVRSPIPKPEK